MSLSPEERSLRGRLAAQVRWSKEDPRPGALRAHAGLERKFLDEVDPDRVLPAYERARRVESARRAFYTRLALASSKARRRAGGGG